MRLLVLGNNYPPHTLGGYELLCRDHVAWLCRRGHAVTVLTTTYGVDGKGPVDEAGEAGERVVRALDFHWADFEHRLPEGAALWEGERRQRRALERILTEERPQAALVWHMAAVSKSLLAVLHRHRVPIVLVLLEPWPAWDVEGDPWLRLWQGPGVRPAVRLLKPPLRHVARRMVAPTDVGPALSAAVPTYCSEHLRHLVEDAVLHLRGRGTVVGAGIHIDRFLVERDPDEPLASPVRLLSIGRVERRKGVHTAVEALAGLRERGVAARLSIVGWPDEAYVNELRDLAAHIGVADAVHWHEPVPRERVREVYAAHDIVLFPTIWQEPFGLVPIEAMAGGCVAVATGTGGSGEFLEDGVNALLFPPSDAAAAADRVARLAGDPALLARLRRAGAATARAHDFDGYAARLEELVVLAAGAG